jgi:hypothetical protein
MASGNGNGHDPEWLRLLKGKYKRVVPPQVRKFFTVYATESALDATKAARVVGYKHPATMGHRLRSKFPDVAEACEISWKEQCGIKPDELIQHLASIVRDPDHKDRMKAIELNAKIHGMLSEKIIHEFDKNTLLKQIDERLLQIKEQRALEAGVDLTVSVEDPTDIT